MSFIGIIEACIRRIVEAWFLVALIAKAAILVPLGLFLLMFAGSTAWGSDGNAFPILFAIWLAYVGGKFLFGTLAAFIGATRQRDPSIREALRRARMLGRQ